MIHRVGRFWVMLAASALAWAMLVAAGAVEAASLPPLSTTWNIAPTGKAESSGELLFRVTPADGADPVEVTVSVTAGATDAGIASSIRRAFATQLDTSAFDVVPGEGANVQITAESRNRGFALELLDSDVQNVRVLVRSVTPVAPPTVPQQSQPAITPAPGSPPEPGDATAPAGNQPPTPPAPATPSAPPSAPPATPSAPESAPANGGAGAPASAPPPPPGAAN